MALFLFLASFGHKPAFLRKRRLVLYKHGGTTVKNQKGAYTMQNCQDNFYTTFGSFLQIQDYHRQQTKASQWRKCKINDLCVEPLSTTSPLMGNLSAFAAGTTADAVEDTTKNLGLAIRVDGELYPVRMTAYKSLLDRAKIGGTALPKLDRKVLADTLNALKPLMDAFAEAHNYRWQAGMNGRSGGYLVLYQGETKLSQYKSYCTCCGQRNYRIALDGDNTCGVCRQPSRINYQKPPKEILVYPGRGTDYGEDFEDWSMDELRERVRLVQE